LAPSATTNVGTPAGAGSTARSSRSSQSGATRWWEIAGLAAAVGLALAAALFTRRLEAADEDVQPGPLVALLDDSLEDLLRDPDPRRAVIASYARMERGLGARGLVRHPADTPMEYLDEILAAHRVSEGPASRLTDLFERAKFSDHRIDEDIRQEAIAALEAVRAKLRADQLAADQLAANQLAREPAGDGAP
jgi:hypothetical protein